MATNNFFLLFNWWGKYRGWLPWKIIKLEKKLVFYVFIQVYFYSKFYIFVYFYSSFIHMYIQSSLFSKFKFYVFKFIYFKFHKFKFIFSLVILLKPPLSELGLGWLLCLIKVLQIFPKASATALAGWSHRNTWQSKRPLSRATKANSL